MNREQSRLLEKVIKAKIEEKKLSLTDRKEAEIKTIRSKNKSEAVVIAKQIKELEAKKDVLEKKLNAIGYKTDYDGDLSKDLPYDWEESKTLTDKYGSIEKELNRTELKLTAKIYGSTAEFEKVMADIEKELAKL